ncbi:MAG: MarR family transcriptional regulator [Nitrososphaeraceae archaeon]|nr:MarR family transcriptional regulator [Nitrososphaeraceae archaeon]
MIKQYNFDNSIAYKVYRTSRAFQKAFDQELRDQLGLTLSQWRVLNVLVSFNGITQKEIADRLELEAPSLIPILDKLQNLELVERRSDPKDRRINRIYLTKRAEKLYETMYECGLSIIKSATKGINQDQLNSVSKYLDIIINNLINNHNLENFNQDQITTSTSTSTMAVHNKSSNALIKTKMN